MDFQQTQTQKPETYEVCTTNSKKITFPDRKQAITIKYVENTQLIDYFKPIAAIVGAKNITFASKTLNNRVCIYLTSKKIVDQIMESHENMEINKKTVTIRRLCNPPEKITMSNVFPSTPNHILEKILQEHGAKLVSPISILKTEVQDPEFAHIQSFQRTSPDMSAASTPTSAPTSPGILGNYTITRLKKEDCERSIEFLRRFFFRDEPLNVEQNLLETDDATCDELEDFSVKSLYEGVSVMATSTTGDIVGICLNSVLGRDDPEEEDYECPNKKFAKILKLLDFVDREANVFGQFPDVEKIMSLKILSVDGSWRGQGIAKALIDKSRDLCREQGFNIMRVDCTSHYSALAVARLGFECVYTLQYADYHGEDGRPVFVPEPPHSEVKVYVQKVA